MKILKLLFLYLSIFIIPLKAQPSDDFLNEINSKIQLDSLIKYVRELSGTDSVFIGGVKSLIKTRHSSFTGNSLAANYLDEKLSSFGLLTQRQKFRSNGENIIAEQTGVRYPNQKYMICAHYDNMPPNAIAPGADDNASGCAAVLEAARIFTSYNPDYTIVYALWDEEELGLYGSNDYAAKAKGFGDSILGVINLDMIAWDSNDDALVELHVKNVASSIQLSDIMKNLNSKFSFGLDIKIINPGTPYSDHASFWNNNYSALLMIEGYHSNDFNNYYHSTSDDLSKFNMEYFEKCSRLAVNSIGYLSFGEGITDVKEEMIISEFDLYQNYPNPFNPETTINFSLMKENYIIISVYDLLGREIRILKDEFLSAGNYTIEFSGEELTSGAYFLRIKIPEKSKFIKMLLLK